MIPFKNIISISSYSLVFNQDIFRIFVKVFISHSFKDENLASNLKKILEQNSTIKQAYMAQRVKEYELLIVDKIKNEINSSDYVVAIITKNTRESASVNQELGYAQGKDVAIIPMIEEEAKVGVLIHGYDVEWFSREKFDQACNNVLSYILKKGPKKTEVKKGIDSEKLLQKRNLIDPESSEFGINENALLLKSRTPNELLPNGKPFVLFTACPKTLTEFIDINSKEITDWFDKHNTIKINNHNVRFLIGNKKINLDSIVYFDDYSGKGDIYSYIEFRKNGFLEQGFTESIIYSDSTGKGSFVFLHLCFLTGGFWAFLNFCKMYYTKVGFNDSFDVMLSIHNVKDLMLMGFGGRVNDRGSTYAEPFDIWWHDELPRTNLSNISLKIESITVNDLTDEFIVKEVKRFSDQISNAYGLPFSMCYGYDGGFNFDLFSYYRLR